MEIIGKQYVKRETRYHERCNYGHMEKEINIQ